MNIVTHDDGRHHFRELMERDQFVSRLIITDYRMRIGGAEVRMAGVAGVHTERSLRKRGYMRRLMEDSLAYMEGEGYDVSALFGIPGFYTRFGYAVCLASHRLTVATRDAEDAGRDARGCKVRPMSESDYGAVLALYNRSNATRSGSLVRKRAHFSGFPKGTRWDRPAEAFVLEEGRGRPAGYFVLDRSDREVNVVELEGREDSLYPALLRAAARIAISRRCGEIALLMPPDHPFTRFLRRFGCHMTSEYPKNGGGLMRIINQESLMGKLGGEFERRLAAARVPGRISLRFKTDIGDTSLAIGRGASRSTKPGSRCALTISQDRLMQLLAGYRGLRDVINDPKVKWSGDLETAEALFAGPVPHMWLADYF